MKKELNKKRNKKELIFWPFIYQNYFLPKIVLSKIMKHLRLKYVLVMYVLWQKNNLGCKINCQERYLHEVGK